MKTLVPVVFILFTAFGAYANYTPLTTSNANRVKRETSFIVFQKTISGITQNCFKGTTELIFEACYPLGDSYNLFRDLFFFRQSTVGDPARKIKVEDGNYVLHGLLTQGPFFLLSGTEIELSSSANLIVPNNYAGDVFVFADGFERYEAVGNDNVILNLASIADLPKAGVTPRALLPITASVKNVTIKGGQILEDNTSSAAKQLWTAFRLDSCGGAPPPTNLQRGINRNKIEDIKIRNAKIGILLTVSTNTNDPAGCTYDSSNKPWINQNDFRDITFMNTLKGIVFNRGTNCLPSPGLANPCFLNINSFHNIEYQAVTLIQNPSASCTAIKDISGDKNTFYNLITPMSSTGPCNNQPSNIDANGSDTLFLNKSVKKYSLLTPPSSSNTQEINLSNISTSLGSIYENL